MPIINCRKNENKALPMSYVWAHKYYRNSIVRNWTPEEISMQCDLNQWLSATVLTDDERVMVLRTIGYFSTASSFTVNNIILTAYKHITNQECRQYLLRQAYEMSIHTEAFIQCCDTLGLDPEEIYSMHQTIETMSAKDDFVAQIAVMSSDKNFSLDTTKNIQKFIFNLVAYYIIMEGIFFYTGFAMMLMLRRRNKLAGIGQLFENIMRDQTTHVAFGCDIIKEICIENPTVWTPAFKDELMGMIKHAVTLEKNYVEDICPYGIMGVDAEQFGQYIDYIADTRLEQIGLPKLFQQVNPFKWISQSFEKKPELMQYHTTEVKY
ncbi:hypothetical protein A3F06_00860 [candidate division TM6 bacterium RIFCSPHIGHO2_12_FULL_36_22]|nr:MAG: hypothetical protein A3F06_00860 [candidate division TM6 bacterium RIFCSPHIGHO2_12_FULL_36_22]